MNIWLRNLKASVHNFIYFRKLNFYNVLHRLFPSMHRYEWCDVFECGCCGFEGVACSQCDSRVIIGHAGHPLESGDIVEYNY